MESCCLQNFRAHIYGTRQINATIAYMSKAPEELKTYFSSASNAALTHYNTATHDQSHGGKQIAETG